MSQIAKVQPLPNLAQIAAAFPKRRVLVVGDLVADHYIYGQTDRVSREAPVLVVRYEASEVKLGGAANAAANVRSLGGQVTAVGILGADEMGRELRRQFKAAGMRLVAVSSKDIETETKTRILAGGVSTTRQQMLRLDRGARGALRAHQRAQMMKRLSEGAGSADALVVSDYGGGLIDDGCRQLLRQLAADGLPVCVDSRYQLRSFTSVTVCKPNEPELETLTRIQLRSPRDLIRAGKAAVKMLSCQALVVTRGRNGMAVFDRQGHCELMPVYGLGEAVDVTGAGDTVIAALTLSLGAGASVIDAARIANVAAGLVVQKQGTATVAREELLRELTGSGP
jgi:rfaE bifunctional protein kinase chain/domain